MPPGPDADRRRERAVAAWGGCAFGAVLASLTSFRSVRDALVLDGDPDRIPWLFASTFVAVIAISPWWSAALARRSPRQLVPLVIHAFAVCEVGFGLLVHAELSPVWVGRAFYVWSAVFNLFVVSVLWSLFADLLGPRAAGRLYGPITAGGTIGAIVGPALTKLFVHAIGIAGVLAVAAALLELAALCVGRVQRAGMAGETREPAPAAGGAWTGFAQVARSPYLRAIVGYVLCTAFAATFLYLEQVHVARGALADRVARTDFFSSVDLATNSCVLVVQALLAAPLLRALGPALVLCALPLVQAVAICTLAGAPSLTALAIALVVSRTATHGLTRPARELLFTVLDHDDKYRAKNAIDTTFYRLGDFGASWIMLAGASGAVMIVTTIPLVLVWLALTRALGAGFRRAGSKEVW